MRNTALLWGVLCMHCLLPGFAVPAVTKEAAHQVADLGLQTLRSQSPESFSDLPIAASDVVAGPQAFSLIPLRRQLFIRRKFQMFADGPVPDNRDDAAVQAAVKASLAQNAFFRMHG